MIVALLTTSLAAAGSCGTPAECVEWGRRLAEGEGVERNERAAARGLRAACRDGAADGCAWWGQVLLRSDFPPDQTRGRELVDTSCEQGSIVGCGWAAAAADQRDDPSAALRFLEAACRQGDVDTCLSLARRQEDPRAKADVWDLACGHGHAASCRWVGQNVGAGAGDAEADQRAFAAFERGCELGDRSSCRHSASALADGRGTEPDPARAVERLERGCDLGDAWSCSEAARALTSWPEVTPDPTRAVRHLNAACSLGSTWSCSALARRAAVGDGLPRDLRQAESWLERAGETGAALLRSAGDGPLRDQRLGCVLGDPDACDALAAADPALAPVLRREAARLREPASAPVHPPTGPVDPELRACFASAVERLAAPEMAGRAPGTPGNARAAEEITRRLSPLEVRVQAVAAPVARRATSARLVLDGQPQWGSPLPFSGSGAFGAPVRDAGCAPPEGLEPGEIAWFRGCDRDRIYSLALAAEARGASAVLWTDAGDDASPRAVLRGRDWWEVLQPLAIPVIASAEDLRVQRAEGEVRLEDELAEVRNLIGVLPGKGALGAEVIVIGAHYDHLGTDERGRVYRGADDNASGVAAMTCAIPWIRERLAPLAEHRAVLFVAFDGEETGMLGSEAFVAAGAHDVAAMVALDMVGRLGDRSLGIAGTESAAWDPLIARAAASSGLGTWRRSGHGRSDHFPFLASGVPAVHLTTGVHRAWHQIGDVPEQVDADGGARVTALASELVSGLAVGPRLAPRPGCGGEGLPLLGVGIRWTRDPEPGVEVLCVDPGLGADLGLRPGDRISGVNGEPVDNPVALGERVAREWPLEPLLLEVRRGGATLVLPAAAARAGSAPGGPRPGAAAAR